MKDCRAGSFCVDEVWLLALALLSGCMRNDTVHHIHGHVFGTQVEVIAHFDNSTANKFNPDPNKDVRWGDQTWEEMMIGFWGTVVERQ